MIGSSPLIDAVTPTDLRTAYEQRGLWNGDVLADRVAAHAAEWPDSLAVVDAGGARRFTYGRLEEDANRLANQLLDMGVRPGDVVSVQLPNWYETVVVDVAILRVGAVLNPLLTIYRGKELQHVLSTASVGVVFTPGVYRSFDHKSAIDALRDDLPALRHHVVVEPPGDGVLAAGYAATRLSFARDASAVSELMFTSGTEAAPKAIMHTEQTTECAVRLAAASIGLGAGDVIWMPSPIGHSTGLNFGVRVALHYGLPLVLQDRWSAEEAAALVLAHGCSYTVAATTFLSDLVEHARTRGLDLASLRLFGSGGAAVPPELVSAAGEVGINVLRLYGSTESLVVTWNRPGSPKDKRIGTDGIALDHVHVEVRDDDGRALVGEPGEIFVQSPCNSVGLYNDPERTAFAFSEGWVREGDLGVIDSEGYLTIVGRKKEIIIRGGLNIAPREIEEVLARYASISEVAVVGVPDARLGEKACACIVPAGEASVGFDDVVAFLRDQGLAPYKLPERVEIFDELPRTPTGKVQKFELTELLRERDAGAAF